MIFVALIVEVVIVEFVVMNVVDSVLSIADETLSVTNSPLISARVELILMVLTTILFSFKLLVQLCLELELTVRT